ncbi:MAG: hypothetical protein H7837_09920 [Magnetococcus sp. MYC-9]
MRLLSEILHTQLSTKADVAKVDVHVLELRRDIADTNARIAMVEAGLKQNIATVEASLKQNIATVEANLKRDLETTKAELRKDIETTKVELRKDIETTKVELRKDIETTKAELQKEISVTVANAKTEIIKWVVGMGVVILGDMMTINRVFPPVPAYYQPPAQEMRQQAPAPSPATPTSPAH